MRRTLAAGRDPPGAPERVVQIRVPRLGDQRLQHELEETIRQTASRIIALVARHG